MKKYKSRYQCLMCACTQTRTLSDEAAVEIHEFLEVIAANFLNRYTPPASGAMSRLFQQQFQRL